MILSPDIAAVCEKFRRGGQLRSTTRCRCAVEREWYVHAAPRGLGFNMKSRIIG